jgi:dihydroorotate dehydrogenase
MKYFYSASVMGYGEGRKWHRYYNFPKLPMVTKTLTWKPKIGIPFAILKYGNSVWNRVGLHNMGFFNWFTEYYLKWSDDFKRNIIVSIAGTDWQIESMVGLFETVIGYEIIGGIEINCSCPNVKNYNNIIIPKTDIPLYLKLNWEQDPYDYDLNNITGIRVNSVPGYFGGISGKAAQKYNWAFIKKFNREGLNVSGCSMTFQDDVKIFEDMGCKDIGIGSVILTNPSFVEGLEDNDD